VGGGTLGVAIAARTVEQVADDRRWLGVAPLGLGTEAPPTIAAPHPASSRSDQIMLRRSTRRRVLADWQSARFGLSRIAPPPFMFKYLALIV
jgi:hypothetical protein